MGCRLSSPPRGFRVKDVSMNISKLRRYIPVFRASALRVLLEIAIIQIIFTLAYPLIFGGAFRNMHFSEPKSFADQSATRMTIVQETYYFFLFIISIVWCVMRWLLRPSQRTVWRQCLHEIGMSIILCLELIVCQILFSTDSIPCAG